MCVWMCCVGVEALTSVQTQGHMFTLYSVNQEVRSDNEAIKQPGLIPDLSGGLGKGFILDPPAAANMRK